MRKNLFQRLCRYNLAKNEGDLALKINFMLVFLFLAVFTAMMMAILRFMQGAMMQVVIDGTVSLAALLLLFILTQFKNSLLTIARMMVALIFVGLFFGIFFAPPTTTSLLAILLVFSLAYMFFPFIEFLVWIGFFLIALFTGELLLMDHPHLEGIEFLVILVVIFLIIYILYLSDKAKEIHQIYQIEEADARRNALLGKMVSMIAHQWRQPLSSITAITSKLEMKALMDKLQAEDLHEDLQKVESITLELSQTLNQFRDVFQIQLHKENYRIASLIKEVVKTFVQSHFDLNIDISIELNSSAEVFVNKLDLEKVIVIILENAYEQFTHKSKAPKIIIHSKAVDHNIIVCIKNSGEKISEAVIPMIFDPYFSTKEANQGVGLGLFVAKNLMKKNDGEIFAVNEEDGVRFEIYLPKSKVI